MQLLTINTCHILTQNKVSYIVYLDANNLYGYTMIKKLPIDSFKWIDDLEKFTSESIY